MITHALTAEEFANNVFSEIVEPLIALIAFIALLLFVWFAGKVVRNSGEDAEKRKENVKKMFIAMFGLFLIFSVYTVFIFVIRLSNSETEIEKQERLEFGEFEIIRRGGEVN